MSNLNKISDEIQKKKKYNHDAIINFSQLPRKCLLAYFSIIKLGQIVEFTKNDIYDLTIFEMQLEHIKIKTKELNAIFLIYQTISNNISMSNKYMLKFIQNDLIN